MSVELRPLGVNCNIACQYCYQHPQRDANNGTKAYDMEKMKQAILKEGGPFSLFGGEPLLLPLDDLEELFSWGLQQFGSNAIQTNATLITPRHIELFKKYKVSVGVSVDGPGELNDIRWARTLQNTRKLTEQTHANIKLLTEVGIFPGIIITLHKGNALADKLPRMGEWLKEMDALGIRTARLHLMEIDHVSVGQHYRLSVSENIEAMLYFHKLQSEMKQLRFDVFKEIAQLLKANDNSVSCVWNACDPYTTSAVKGVEGDGKRTNCGRTNKEGIDFVKAAIPSFIRYIALYNTPREHGGCQGCRFFAMCKGHCPGTSIEGDWRNRTEHCSIWETLFSIQEAEMLEKGEVPLSKHALLPLIEKYQLDSWAEGKNTSIQKILKRIMANQTAKVEEQKITA